MQIDVEKIKEDEKQFVFEVLLDENDQQPPFTVTVEKEYYKKLTSGEIAPEKLIEKSFGFLIEREPKEAILKEFNLDVISKYFPEYEQEIAKYWEPDHNLTAYE